MYSNLGIQPARNNNRTITKIREKCAEKTEESNKKVSKAKEREMK